MLNIILFEKIEFTLLQMIKRIKFNTIIFLLIIGNIQSCKYFDEERNKVEWVDFIFKKDNIKVMVNKYSDTAQYWKTFENFDYYKKHGHYEQISGIVSIAS